jgi:hypothetical protein
LCQPFNFCWSFSFFVEVFFILCKLFNFFSHFLFCSANFYLCQSFIFLSVFFFYFCVNHLILVSHLPILFRYFFCQSFNFCSVIFYFVSVIYVISKTLSHFTLSPRYELCTLYHFTCLRHIIHPLVLCHFIIRLLVLNSWEFRRKKYQTCYSELSFSIIQKNSGLLGCFALVPNILFPFFFREVTLRPGRRRSPSLFLRSSLSSCL